MIAVWTKGPVVSAKTKNKKKATVVLVTGFSLGSSSFVPKKKAKFIAFDQCKTSFECSLLFILRAGVSVSVVAILLVL